MSDVDRSREAAVAAFAARHGVALDEAAALWDVLRDLVDHADQNVDTIASGLDLAVQGVTSGAAVPGLARGAVLHFALRDLRQADEAPMSMSMAAASRPARGIARQKVSTPRQPRPVFEHVPTGLFIYDGAGGSLHLDAKAHAEIVHIGAFWSRVEPTSMPGFSLLANVTYAALRDAWERRAKV